MIFNSIHRHPAVAAAILVAASIGVYNVLELSPDETAVATLPAIDGDTFVTGNVTIRLCGIDAPELGTIRGAAARDYLTLILDRGPASCFVVGNGTPCDGRSPRESYGRLVAQCWVAGEDVAQLMVDSGHARDWPEFSGGYYGRP